MNEPRGFVFPARIEVSAMGAADAGLAERVPAMVAAAGVVVVPESLRLRPSRTGKYLSVTVSIECPDRASYDAVHSALRADPAIQWTL